MAFNTTEKLNNADKLSLQITGTANDSPGTKWWYNEQFTWAPIVPPNKLWAAFNTIPGAANPTEADTAVATFPSLLEKRKVQLTLDIASNNRAYLARQVYGDDLSDLYENWIQPALIRDNGAASNGYIVRFYNGDPDGAGVEITTTHLGGAGGAPSWAFNYSSGILAVSTDQSSVFRGYYDANDLYIVGYRYIGPSVSGGGGGTLSLPFVGIAEIDVNHSLGYRPIVQVLEKRVGGIFGGGGFGEYDFGSSPVYEIMNPDNFYIWHLSPNSFKLVMNNYRDGEVLYS